MIPVILMTILGATSFISQEIPGLTVTDSFQRWTGGETNFRNADIDRDGLLDLIMPSEVWFQSEGMFPDENKVALPDIEQFPLCDILGSRIFLRLKSGLKVMEFHNGSWQQTLSQEISWPDSAQMEKKIADQLESDSTARVLFSRFLHDFNGDSEPEIVVLSKEGVNIFIKNTDIYKKIQCHGVSPSMQLEKFRHQALWPAQKRNITLPSMTKNYGLLFRDDLLSVLVWEPAPDNKQKYHSHNYKFDKSDSFSISKVSEIVSGEMPRFCYPHELNKDGTIDFAGGRLERRTTSSIPLPVTYYETWASTDGGKNFQTRRARSFPPQSLFEDVDDDGDLDMITETKGLFRGGIRESVSRIVTSRKLRHGLHVHYQNEKGLFSEKPDVSTTINIQFKNFPYKMGKMFQRYTSGELLNVSGDFNADGMRDIVVQDKPDRIAIYLFNGKAFSGRPYETIVIPENRRFAVADVDADGRSDIVIMDDCTDERGCTTTVFFNREILQ